MALLTGTRLGPYEILSAIGVGGMGEVYKARDTRLDRIVAIKVLPDHVANRSDLRERFEREARTIASLNHPHICVLHDIGRQDGIDFLVMEYLEGETLAQRLAKRPLPLEQVFQYAIEIADALDKAHRKGVTHRDLKPGNIMITAAGTKLLDFGLAKLKPGAAAATEAATRENAPTEQGRILGTLQYMAPEQVEGGDVDPRTDIFAFGALVYEMATGKKAFEGKTSASVMAKILESEPPPMSSLQPMMPLALDRVAKKCLRKNPDERWQSVRDVMDELKWIAESPAQAAGSTAAVGPTHTAWRKRLVWAAAALVACLVTGLAVWILKPVTPPPVTRLAISLSPGQQLAGVPAIALSPDGRLLAYVASPNGGVAQAQLYLRGLDSLEARPMPGTEGAFAPFFSPDGQWIGFSAGGKLKKVAVSGGAPVTLCDLPLVGLGSAATASWGADNTIVLGYTARPGLWQVSAAGGALKPLTTTDPKRIGPPHAWPEFLPNGKAVLFSSSPSVTDWANAQIAVHSLQTGEERDLIQGGTSPNYAPTGHLIYAQAGTLMAVPFDPQRLVLTGTATPALEGVLQSGGTRATQYSLSRSGTLVYVPGAEVPTARMRMVWVDRKGVEQPIAAPAHTYVLPRLSPDGQRVAAGIEEGESNIWSYDLRRDTLSRLTFEGNGNVDPVWTPDGKRIVYKTNRPDRPNVLFWQPADGSGAAEALTSSELSKFNNVPGSWSPDGQLLAFTEDTAASRDIWVLRLSDRKPQPFLQTPFRKTAPRFSPDGRWLAYASEESGRYEIYVQPYPGPGGKWQISAEGATEAVWNPNGRELFYRNGDKMMAVDVTTQPSFTAGKPKMLFEGRYVRTPRTFADYDVSPDGQRFLMLKATEQAQASAQINVVLNWFEELKRRAPAEKK